MGHFGLDAHISQNLIELKLSLFIFILGLSFTIFFFIGSPRERRNGRCAAMQLEVTEIPFVHVPLAKGGCVTQDTSRRILDALTSAPYKGEGKANTRFKP